RQLEAAPRSLGARPRRCTPALARRRSRPILVLLRVLLDIIILACGSRFDAQFGHGRCGPRFRRPEQASEARAQTEPSVMEEAERNEAALACGVRIVRCDGFARRLAFDSVAPAEPQAERERGQAGQP